MTSCQNHHFQHPSRFDSRLYEQRIIVPQSHHKLLNKKFLKTFFHPWSNPNISFKESSLQETFKRFKKNPGFNEAKTQRSKSWIESLELESSITSFPSVKRRAISVASTSLRLLPTFKPHYNSIDNHADDYPLDNFQVSALPANTPVLILHFNKTRSWAYVYAGFASGWVSMKDLAFVSNDFIHKFKSFSFVSIVKEKVPLYLKEKKFLYRANIGMIFPYIKSTKYSHIVKIAYRNSQGYAILKRAYFSKNAGVLQPYLITPKRIERLAKRLLDQPYGWGGLFGNRDCSSLIRDLFIPFSINLPRNSAAQAKHAGVFIDLSGFINDDEKEAFIAKNALPYLTLLWLPGHVMLYVGTDNGRVMVLHNLWGVRSIDSLKRKIVGKSIISNLEPKLNEADVDRRSTLLKRLSGMTVLFPRY